MSAEYMERQGAILEVLQRASVEKYGADHAYSEALSIACLCVGNEAAMRRCVESTARPTRSILPEFTPEPEHDPGDSPQEHVAC